MKRKLNLGLFAEGEGSSGDSTRAVAESKGVLSQVKYGKTQEAPQQQEADTKDARARFEELIKGEYKDAFAQRTQDIIDKRFKETKVLESFRDDVNPIIETLYGKYGVSDINDLKDAIDNDSSYWEERAEQEGLTVEQYKQKKKLEAENNQFRRLQEQQVREHQAQQQYQQWLNEGEEVKKMYPQFDLATESQNPRFVDLLVKGINVQTAFEVIHMNDIKMMSAQARQKAVVNSVRANGLRPSENGVARQSGVVTKSDVSKLTKADRAEIARRVQRGEHIEF